MEVFAQPTVEAVAEKYGLPKTKAALVWDQHRARRLQEFINRFFFYREPDATLVDTDLPRLEDILSQIDLAIEEGRPLTSRYPLHELRDLREDIVYTIYVALEASLAKGSSGGILDKLVARLTDEDSIISFNYDLLIDFSLFDASPYIDYGFSARRTSPTGFPYSDLKSPRFGVRSSVYLTFF